MLRHVTTATIPGSRLTTSLSLVPPLSRRESWMQIMLGLTIVLNLLDASLTLFFVRAGLAVEANPLMDQLLAGGPVVFVVGKMAIVSLGVTLLWRLRQLTLAAVGSAAALITYGLTLFWHLPGLSRL